MKNSILDYFVGKSASPPALGYEHNFYSKLVETVTPAGFDSTYVGVLVRKMPAFSAEMDVTWKLLNKYL